MAKEVPLSSDADRPQIGTRVNTASCRFEEGMFLKWGGYNRRGEERFRRVLGRVFVGRALFILLVIIALGSLLSETPK